MHIEVHRDEDEIDIDLDRTMIGKRALSDVLPALAEEAVQRASRAAEAVELTGLFTDDGVPAS